MIWRTYRTAEPRMLWDSAYLSEPRPSTMKGKKEKPPNVYC